MRAEADEVEERRRGRGLAVARMRDVARPLLAVVPLRMTARTSLEDPVKRTTMQLNGLKALL